MKNKVVIIIIICCLTFSGAVYAQESGFPHTYEVDPPERGYHSDQQHDGPGYRPNQLQDDTPSNNARSQNEFVRKEESAPEESNDDDDIISFNFLYYIIQKYKMSDIVE